MKKNYKKIISAVVASSMLLSLAGCADKANEQVLEAADSFASAVKSMNAKKITKACTEDLDEDEASIIQRMCEIDTWDTEDNLALIDIVKDSIEYEVDEESVEASTKKGEGSVDITFTMLDWESVIDDESVMTDVDTAKAAMEDADTTEVTVTVEFELEDEEWVVTNGYDVFVEVFEFADSIDVEFVAPLEVDYLMWYYTDNGSFREGEDEAVYTNVTQIDLDVIFVDYAPCDNVYYTVESNGVLLYTSATGNRMGYYDSTHGATYDENGYIPAGVYTISFYNEDELIATSSCTVIVNVTSTTTTTTSGAISCESDEDFYTIAYYTDSSYQTTTESYATGCDGFYIKCRTWAYYDAGTTFSCAVSLDGEYIDTVTYDADADSCDTAYFSIVWTSGRTMDSGVYTLDFTGYEGTHWGTVTIVVE